MRLTSGNDREYNNIKILIFREKITPPIAASAFDILHLPIHTRPVRTHSIAKFFQQMKKHNLLVSESGKYYSCCIIGRFGLGEVGGADRCSTPPLVGLVVGRDVWGAPPGVDAGSLHHCSIGWRAVRHVLWPWYSSMKKMLEFYTNINSGLMQESMQPPLSCAGRTGQFSFSRFQASCEFFSSFEFTLNQLAVLVLVVVNMI